MAKRTKKSAKKAPKTENAREIAYLQRILALTVRAGDDTSEFLRDLFAFQANKIEGKIKKLEEKQ